MEAGLRGHLGLYAECKINKLRTINVMEQFESPFRTIVLIPANWSRTSLRDIEI
jgi:hypothetical protein